MRYQDNYRFLFGTGKRGEWLIKPTDHYEQTIYKAFTNARGNTLYIYDEYQNLVGIILDSEPLCRRLFGILNRRYKIYAHEPFGVALGATYRGCLHDLLNELCSRNYSNSWEWACEVVARTFVMRAKRLTKEAKANDRVLPVSAGR